MLKKLNKMKKSSISVVSNTQSKIITVQGRKQVVSLSSVERGQTVSVEICFKAAGTYISPILIFLRQRMKTELLDHASPRTISACNRKGCMITEIFTICFKYFIQFWDASPTNKLLLLLGGNTQNLDSIEHACRNWVIIVYFPPHCTPKLKPTDVAFIKRLSNYYGQNASNWLRSHLGRVITMFQISEILRQAYLQAS